MANKFDHLRGLFQDAHWVEGLRAGSRHKLQTRISHAHMPSKDQVSGFIRTSFRSVWALELLCLLRQHRDRSLTHQEMVDGLRGSDLVVTQSVDNLTSAGLVAVEENGAARYAPASEELDRLVVKSESLYATSPDAVRRMIVSASNPGITAFADAFRLRKD